MFTNYMPATNLLRAAKAAVNSPSAVTLEALSRAVEAADKATGEAEVYAAEIEQARESYETDDIEIDDTPAISPGDGGVWVNAWVWVQNDD